jgi:hypothetical protein
MAPLFMYYVVTTLGIALAKRELLLTRIHVLQIVQEALIIITLYMLTCRRFRRTSYCLCKKENLFVGLFIIL